MKIVRGILNGIDGIRGFKEGFKKGLQNASEIYADKNAEETGVYFNPSMLPRLIVVIFCAFIGTILMTIIGKLTGITSLSIAGKSLLIMYWLITTVRDLSQLKTLVRVADGISSRKSVFNVWFGLSIITLIMVGVC